MRALRTPDDRFAGLPDFPYEPHYVEVPAGDGTTDRLRVHYLDEGPPDGRAVLLLHGEPSWSYLYRHMVPELTMAGLRCVVPDLIGFGRSDKPADRNDYTYARHVHWMSSVVFDHLDLRGITLFGQDWGGLIGLRLLAAAPERFDAVVIANTGLPTGDGRVTEAFLNWQRFSQETPVLPVGRLVAGGFGGDKPDPNLVAAYDAPFPDDSYKEGARQFPALVPTRPDDPASDDNRRAWQVLDRWEKPFVTAFSDADPITRGGERVFLARVPGARGRENVTMKGGGHFLQETHSRELAAVIIDTVRSIES